MTLTSGVVIVDLFVAALRLPVIKVVLSEMVRWSWENVTEVVMLLMLVLSVEMLLKVVIQMWLVVVIVHVVTAPADAAAL